jgi:ABC-type lipoprotein release transport system permease subunit
MALRLQLKLIRAFSFSRGVRPTPLIFGIVCLTLVCTTSLFAVSFVFDGFWTHLRTMLLQTQPHATVFRPNEDWKPTALENGDLNQLFAVLESAVQIDGLAAAHVAYDEVLVFNATRSVSQRSVLVGVERTAMSPVLPFFSPLQQESNGTHDENRSVVPIVITTATAKELAVQTGDIIHITLYDRRTRVEVIGVIDAGVISVPYVVFPIWGLKKALGETELAPNYIFVRFKNGYVTSKSCDELQKLLKPIIPGLTVVQFWEEKLESVFGVLNSFKFLVFAIVSALVVLASVFSFASFDILITRKRRQLAVLMAMGMKPSSIRCVFLAISICVSLLSTLFGFAVGFVLVSCLHLLPLEALLDSTGLARVPCSVNVAELPVVLILVLLPMTLAAFCGTRAVGAVEPGEAVKS